MQQNESPETIPQPEEIIPEKTIPDLRKTKRLSQTAPRINKAKKPILDKKVPHILKEEPIEELTQRDADGIIETIAKNVSNKLSPTEIERKKRAVRGPANSQIIGQVLTDEQNEKIINETKPKLKKELNRRLPKRNPEGLEIILPAIGGNSEPERYLNVVTNKTPTAPERVIRPIKKPEKFGPEEFDAAIKNAKKLDEVYAALRKSQREIKEIGGQSPELIIEAIASVRRGQLPIEEVPREFGLRKKVQEIIKELRIREAKTNVERYYSSQLKQVTKSGQQTIQTEPNETQKPKNTLIAWLTSWFE